MSSVHKNKDLSTVPQRSSLSETKSSMDSTVKDDQPGIDPLRVVANLTHELKTPLHAILSTASILQSELDGKLNDEQKKQVGIVIRNGEHLLEMITSLLHYSSTLTSSRNIRLQKISLSRLIDEMVQEITSLAVSRKISLKLVDDSEKREIYSDRDLIKRILSNILSNALKFTKPDGSVEIYVQDYLEGVLKVNIADTGVGMSPATKEKIFSAFYQADSSSTREFGGVGLGLSLVSNACAQIQAKIKVESEIGSGSIFTIEIPDLKTQIEKNTVLVISEDASFSQSLRLILENELHKVLISSLIEVTKGAHPISPDLIIIDDYSPQEPREIVKKIRESTHSEELCMLALLNAKDAVKRAAFLDAGFQEILYKPFDAKELNSKINSYLKYKIR